MLLIVAGCIAPTPSPAIVQETVQATLTATQADTPVPTNTLLPTATKTPKPTITPIPTILTATKGPTNTPNPNAIASDFIYYFKDNFQFYASKMTPKVEVELIKFVFEYDNESNLNLILETKSGEVVLQENTPLSYSLAQLTTDLEKGQKLPEGINEVLFTFRNNDLEIHEQVALDWEVLSDYIENDITFEQMFAAIRTLP